MKQLVSVCSLLLLCSMQAFAHPSVDNAWIRLLPPNVTKTAAYAEIKTGHADKILAVKSDIAKTLEMHESTMSDGMMNMRPIETIDLVENQGATLSPQGKHIMLIDLVAPLQEGQIVPITFVLEESGEMTFEFEVRKP